MMARAIASGIGPKALSGARLYGEGMSPITRSIAGPEASAGSLSQIATPFLDPRVTLGDDRVRGHCCVDGSWAELRCRFVGLDGCGQLVERCS